MSVYMTEEEQIENLKKLWEKYGNIISSVILAVAVSIFAWQWWERHQTKMTHQASRVYEQLINSIATNDVSGVSAYADRLVKDYPKTPYADIAALTKAKQEVEKKNVANAIVHLNWVIKHSKVKTFRQIARIRIARILMGQKQYQQGLDQLQTVEDKAFQAIIADLKGDLYLAQGQQEKARLAYITALQETPALTLNHSLTQMKLIEIAAPEHHVAQSRQGETA